MKNFKRILLFNLVIWCCDFQTFVFAQMLEDTVCREEQNRDTILVPHEELDWDCLRIPYNRYIIIRSYKELCYFMNNGFDTDCTPIDSTLFNFNKEIIIGFRAIVGGCGNYKDRFQVSINRIDSEEKYTCTVTYSFGICKAIFEVRKIICFPIAQNYYRIEIIDEKYHLSETKLNCHDTY